MKHPRPRRALRPLGAGLIACTLFSSAAASDLSLEGGTQAQVAYGAPFLLELSGKPLAPALVVLDVSPGPVSFLGEDLPIGLTPALTAIWFTGLDGSGFDSVSYPIPNNPSMAGKSVYLMGIVADEAAPSGLDFSNGVRLDIAPPVGAGPSQSVFVGDTAVLDGSGAADADGLLPPGTAVFWQIVAAPAGSAAWLDHATSLFPALVPDLPGDYSLRIEVTAGGATTSAETAVHAWRLQHAATLDGSWLALPFFSVTGSLEGPPAAGLSLNGAPLALGPGGSFGPVTELFAADELFHPLLFEVQHADGSSVRERQTVGLGLAQPLSASSPESVVAHLNQPGLDQVALAAQDEFAAVDIATLLAAIPATKVADQEGLFGFTIFSATVKFKGLSYSSNVDVALTPTASGIDGTVRLYDVVGSFDVWGEVLEIDYSLDGQVTSSPVDMSAVLQFSASGGQVHASVSNVQVNMQNFDFDLDGFLGDVAELFIIESYVRDEVEGAVASAIASEMGPAIEEILGGFSLSGNLYELMEVDVQVDAPISRIAHQANGVTIFTDGQVQVLSAEPGSPVVTYYRAVPSTAPAFGSTTPGGLAYGAALGAADDFVNQVLAAATGAGLLDGDPSVLLADPGGGGGPLDLTAAVMAALFPGAGFSKFPGDTPVTLHAHGTMPPVLSTTPGQSTSGLMELADLEIVFGVQIPGGELPLLCVSLDGSATMHLDLHPRGTIQATVGDSAIAAQVLRGFPGSNPTVLQAGLDFLADLLLPTLTGALGGIPVPSLEAEGLGVVPGEVALIGGGSEYVGFFGELVLIPTGP